MNRSKHVITILITILATTAMLAGCSPRASQMKQAENLGMPKLYPNVGVSASAHTPGLNWWEDFGDTGLNNYIKKVIDGNLSLAQARSKVEQLREVAKQAGSVRWPMLNLAASGGQMHLAAPQDVTVAGYSVSGQAAYEIDLFNKIASGSNAATLDTQASESDLQSLKLSFTAQAVEHYYLNIELRTKRTLTIKGIAASEESLKQIEHQYLEGISSPAELYQAKERLTQAESQLPAIEAAISTNANALNVLAGEFPKFALMHGDVETEMLRVSINPIGAGMPSGLIKQRPDIKSALIRLSASDKRAGAAAAARLPSLSLTASYGGSSPELTKVLDPANVAWNLLGNLALPIIDGGRRKAEARRAEAKFQEGLIIYKNSVLTAFKEVDDALTKEQTTRRQFEFSNKQAGLKEQTLLLASERYTLGLTGYLPVLMAKQNHYASQQALISAKRQTISARIQLYRALGGGWENQATTIGHSDINENTGDM